MDIAKFFRGTAAYLLGTGLFFTLFLLAYFFVFSQVTANPERVKSILRNSGVYSKIPSVIYDNSVDSEATTSASIPLKSSVVRQAALDTFDPAFVQKSVETVIDGTYGWLNGQYSEPRFNVELKDFKKNFAKSLSSDLEARLKKLPVCTAKQMQKAQKIDAYSSLCLPPGTNIKALVKQARTEAEKSDNFLKQTEVSASTIKDADGKPVFDKYREVPKAYRLAVKLPYILAVICILLGAGLVFISDNRENGLRRVGKLLAISGVLVCFVPLLINRLINSVLQSEPGDRVVTDLVLPVMHEFSKTAGKFYFLSGTVYVLLAVGAFLLAGKIAQSSKGKKA